ncbi:hypothetical protein CsSME_00004088 [Camellia sinensis var. sinensis]
MLLVLRFSHSVIQRLIGTRAGIFTGVTVALYPVSLIKTRLQVASKDAGERGAFSIIRGILRTDGIPGLYRGFGTVVTGAIPTRIIFLTALETTKAATFRLVEPFKLSKPTQAAIANGVAGMAAAVCSQAVFVPIDVVCQPCSYLRFIFYLSYNVKVIICWVWCVNKENETQKGAIEFLNFFRHNNI